jgi:hypothetical protein
LPQSAEVIRDLFILHFKMNFRLISPLPKFTFTRLWQDIADSKFESNTETVADCYMKLRLFFENNEKLIKAIIKYGKENKLLFGTYLEDEFPKQKVQRAINDALIIQNETEEKVGYIVEKNLNGLLSSKRREELFSEYKNHYKHYFHISSEKKKNT